MKTFLKIFAICIALIAIGTPKLSAQLSKSPANSIPSVSGIKLAIAPNPCRGQTMVYYATNPKAGGAIVEVVQLGRGVVMRAPVNGSGQMLVNLTGLPKGIHMVRLITATESVAARVIVQ